MYSAECDINYCLNGIKCRNRRFQNNEWSKCSIRSAGKKGWGLYADEHIKKGTFVIEYCGEIINKEEVDRRLRWKYFGSKNFLFYH